TSQLRAAKIEPRTAGNQCRRLRDRRGRPGLRTCRDHGPGRGPCRLRDPVAVGRREERFGRAHRSGRRCPRWAAMSRAESFRNGGRAVVATLAAHGVDTIFGIPGTHNLEFYRQLPEFGIRAVTPPHVQAAGYGADGYFLVSGRPGVFITTSGPGLTNVITAAATAYAGSRPMLILSPGAPTGFARAGVGVLHAAKDSSGATNRLAG